MSSVQTTLLTGLVLSILVNLSYGLYNSQSNADLDELTLLDSQMSQDKENLFSDDALQGAGLGVSGQIVTQTVGNPHTQSKGIMNYFKISFDPYPIDLSLYTNPAEKFLMGIFVLIKNLWAIIVGIEIFMFLWSRKTS